MHTMSVENEIELQNILNGLSLTADGNRCRGTIKPVANFDPDADAAVLMKAMKGIGTDEDAIILLTVKRSNKQRLEIAKSFKTLYGKDLLAELKSELSFNFQNTILDLYTDPVAFDAMELHNAMKGLGTNEGTLVEILCTRTNSQINAIKECYKTLFKKDLEHDVANDTSGHFKRLLISCLQAKRSEITLPQYKILQQQCADAIVDHALAKRDSVTLYDAGEKKFGTDECVFLQILASKHIYQLRATFREYERLAGISLMQSIIDDMSGDLRKGYKALVRSVTNRPLYFAQRLYKCMKGFGTNDAALIRIIVSRSEIDLEDIKEEFQNKYQKSLAEWVQDETSGDYRKTLLAIIAGS